MRFRRAVLVFVSVIGLARCDTVLDENFRPGSCVPVDLRPVSWWDMDRLATGIVSDIVGGNAATFSGVQASTSGKVGAGWSFTTASEPLLVADASSLRFTSGLTVMAWVNGSSESSAATSRVILDKWSRRSSFDSFSARSSGGRLYSGAVFDGRYVYFVPGGYESTASGWALRYDTRLAFSSASSWKEFNAGSTNGLETKGYSGGVFDGRYIYFSPTANSTGQHANVLRYDTHGEFTETSSWSARDSASTGRKTTRGYVGSIFDGRYLYFVPLFDAGNASHAMVLRYDTHSAFDEATSWSAHDAAHTNTNVLNPSKGYVGGAFDGKYVYFAPYQNLAAVNGGHANVLRHDPAGDFDGTASWSSFNVESITGSDTLGYWGAIFDGRYLYFVPSKDGGDTGQAHGKVLRYDTLGGFQDPSSWSAYDAGATSRLVSKGYRGGLFDGRYVYFMPYLAPSELFHGVMLRYDTRGEFKTASSWSAFDVGATSALTTKGFIGGAFDGRFLYLSPSGSQGILRYDTTHQSSFSLRHGIAESDGLGGARFGTRFMVNTAESVGGIGLPSSLEPGWHLVAGTYDGATLKLYVDGEMTTSSEFTGPLVDSNSRVSLGAHQDGGGGLDGLLDEAQVYDRTLDADTIRSIYRTGPRGICK